MPSISHIINLTRNDECTHRGLPGLKLNERCGGLLKGVIRRSKAVVR